MEFNKNIKTPTKANLSQKMVFVIIDGQKKLQISTEHEK